MYTCDSGERIGGDNGKCWAKVLYVYMYIHISLIVQRLVEERGEEV